MTFDYLLDRPGRVFDLAIDHLVLSGTALAIALAVALPLALVIASVPRLAFPTLSVLGIVYTIPSLALLAFLIPWLGLGRQPAIVVLAAYAQLALVRNTAAGLRGVDQATLEAARGTGMTAWQQFKMVRLPLALPVLIAGVRIAAVSTISLATVTAWINAGGLGTLLFDGIARNNASMSLAGATAIVLLAVSVDVLLRLAERMTPAVRARRAV